MQTMKLINGSNAHYMLSIYFLLLFTGGHLFLLAVLKVLSKTLDLDNLQPFRKLSYK